MFAIVNTNSELLVNTSYMSCVCVMCFMCLMARSVPVLWYLFYMVYNGTLYIYRYV